MKQVIAAAHPFLARFALFPGTQKISNFVTLGRASWQSLLENLRASNGLATIQARQLPIDLLIPFGPVSIELARKVAATFDTLNGLRCRFWRRQHNARAQLEFARDLAELCRCTIDGAATPNQGLAAQSGGLRER